MNKGFTLVELIAVITLLALLIIITTPAYDSISNNIKRRNYNSKLSTIKSETLSFVEKYMKDEVYNGKNDKGTRICFTVDFLIHNGIISSDSDKEEYILNDITGEEYINDNIYLQVFYDYENLKLVALAKDEEKLIYDDPNDETNDIRFEFEEEECITDTSASSFNTY